MTGEELYDLELSQDMEEFYEMLDSEDEERLEEMEEWFIHT